MGGGGWGRPIFSACQDPRRDESISRFFEIVKTEELGGWQRHLKAEMKLSLKDDGPVVKELAMHA